MRTVLATPVTVTPEAAALVASWGIGAELEEMLEHTRRTVPGLRRLEVAAEPAYDTGDDPAVTLRAYRPLSHRWDDRVPQAWARWQVATYPPDVCRRVTLNLIEGGEADSDPLVPDDGSVTVPVRLDPHAAGRVEELGMHEEFRQMLRHVCRSVPGLRRIDVEAFERYDESGPPGVAVEAVADGPGGGAGGLNGWSAEAFGPEVAEHFSLQVRSGDGHAG